MVARVATAPLALPSQEELAPRIEQRAHARIEIRGPADLLFEGRHSPGEVKNVSPHGAFIFTTFSVKPGSVVSVSMVLGADRRVNGQATVRWVRPWNPQNPDVDPGVGVEFAPTETEAVTVLADFVRESAERRGFSPTTKKPT